MRRASDFKTREYIHAPNHPFPLNFDDMTNYEDNCYLLSLTEKQIGLLVTLLQMAYYYTLWQLPNRRQWTTANYEEWQAISDFVERLEACLVSACGIDDLITAISDLSTNIVNKLNTINDTLSNNAPIDTTPALNVISSRLSNINEHVQGIDLTLESMDIPGLISELDQISDTLGNPD